MINNSEKDLIIQSAYQQAYKKAGILDNIKSLFPVQRKAQEIAKARMDKDKMRASVPADFSGKAWGSAGERAAINYLAAKDVPWVDANKIRSNVDKSVLSKGERGQHAVLNALDNIASSFLKGFNI